VFHLGTVHIQSETVAFGGGGHCMASVIGNSIQMSSPYFFYRVEERYSNPITGLDRP